MAGIHREEKTPRRWFRKVAGVPIVLWMLGALATAALALYLVLLTMSGSITTGGFDVYVSTPAPSAVASEGVCTAVTAGDGDVAVLWTGGIAGSTCAITVGFQGNLANASDAVLQSFTLVDDGTWEAGVELSAALGGSCGATIVGAGLETATVTLTIGASASPGETYILDPGLSSGFSWVPSGVYDPLLCE